MPCFCCDALFPASFRRSAKTFALGFAEIVLATVLLRLVTDPSPALANVICLLDLLSGEIAVLVLRGDLSVLLGFSMRYLVAELELVAWLSAEGKNGD